MLLHLRVKNLGILADASLDPSPGLTVITGETGAGKTLLLGGLRLLLGEKPEQTLVGPAEDQTQVDALLDDNGAELGVTRVVPRNGNSRAHLEGNVVSATSLRERMENLVEIVSQHDQLNLRRPGQVLALIDESLDKEGRNALQAYHQTWEAYSDAIRRKDLLGGDEMTLARELDLVRHQSREIEAASLQPELDLALETEAMRLRNLEEIAEHLRTSMGLMERISEDTGEVVARVRKVLGLDPGAGSVAELAEGLAATVAEMGTRLREHLEGMESDPGRLEEVEARLTVIGDLKRKYGRTIDEVLAFARSARQREEELDRLLATAGDIDTELRQAESDLTAAGAELRRFRGTAAARIAEEAHRHLGDLALGTARVEIRLDRTDQGPSGGERPVIWFTSDQSLEPGPLGKVASGGELSRLVLAVRLATRTRGTTTLVFDEVDAGLGGTTALAMGEKLARLARNTQLLCVSHLPQVAAHGDAHYVVERNGSVATVRRVEGEERVTEVARMLAGLPESVAGHQAAAELLETARH